MTTISNTRHIVCKETIVEKANRIGIGHFPFKYQLASFQIIEFILQHPDKFRHTWYRTFVSIHHSMFTNLFGSGSSGRKYARYFKDEILLVKDDYSKEKGVTKGYRLPGKTMSALENYEKNKHIKKSQLSLVYTDGKPIRRLRWAVVGPGAKSKPLGNTPTHCPVDTEAIGKAITALKQQIDHMDGRANTPDLLKKEINKIYKDSQHVKNSVKRAERVRDKLNRTIRELNTILDLASGAIKRGHFPQQFHESESGRFYAGTIGAPLNLQTVSRLTRKIALNLFYSLDIESCHHTVLLALAKKNGWRCERLQYFVNHKKECREKLADQLGISPDRAKTAFIAMIYGARKSVFNGAYRDTFESSENVKRALNFPLFSDLHDELQIIFGQLIQQHDRGTVVINAMGKPKRMPDDPKSVVAHLIQGFEASALRAALSVHSSAVLPLHDGWVCIEPECPREAERAIREATGMHLKVEIERYEIEGL